MLIFNYFKLEFIWVNKIHFISASIQISRCLLCLNQMDQTWVRLGSFIQLSHYTGDHECSHVSAISQLIWEKQEIFQVSLSRELILQARILEWVAIPFSRGSSWGSSSINTSYHHSYSATKRVTKDTEKRANLTALYCVL